MTFKFFISALALTSIALAIPVAASAQASDLGAENFRQADANGDNLLTYAEFATFIDLSAADGFRNAVRVSAGGFHARAFARVDANGDGVVSQAEIQARR
jgi:hypothetical protein